MYLCLNKLIKYKCTFLYQKNISYHFESSSWSLPVPSPIQLSPWFSILWCLSCLFPWQMAAHSYLSEKLKSIKHLNINILNFLPHPQHTEIDHLYSFSLLSFWISEEDFYSSCNFDWALLGLMKAAQLSFPKRLRVSQASLMRRNI